MVSSLSPPHTPFFVSSCECLWNGHSLFRHRHRISSTRSAFANTRPDMGFLYLQFPPLVLCYWPCALRAKESKGDSEMACNRNSTRETPQPSATGVQRGSTRDRKSV